MDGTWACMDGNEATARVPYAASEVIAIYPITPASVGLGQLGHERWRYYEQLAGVLRTVPHLSPPVVPSPDVQPEVESDAGSVS